MIKLIVVFFIGLIEQLMYTKYLISVGKRQKYLSSILMFSYMLLYLFVIDYALKDTDSWMLLIAYALSCGIGNLIVLLHETSKKGKHAKKSKN